MGKKKYLILSIIAVVSVVIDQVTKQMAKSLEARPPVVVLENFWQFTYVENKGSAWGLFSGLSEDIRIPFLVGVSIFAIGFIFYFIHKIEERQPVLLVALGLILGGALGNFIDRILAGSVVDFILWHYRQYRWPVFNMADVFITIGVVLMLLVMLFSKGELSIFDHGSEAKPDAPKKS